MRPLFLFTLVFVFFVLLSIIVPTSADDESQNNTQSEDTNQASSNSSMEENSEDSMKLKQDEILRKKKQEETKRIREEAVRKTMRASVSEECDWRTNPLRTIKGEVCGSYYKVLGLNRKDSLLDKSTIKKAFRQLSLVVHPDKNPSEHAQTAFKAIQEAYECLSDELCKENYDNQLAYNEEKIQWQRQEMKNAIIDKVTHTLELGYYKVSQAANQVVYWGLQAWELAGEFKVNVFDEEWPVGRPLLVILLTWKGLFAIQLYGLAFLIVRVNHEIAKGMRF